MFKCPKCGKNNFTFGKISDIQIYVCEDCNFIFDVHRNKVDENELNKMLNPKKIKRKKKK